jgi:hypothetical protein
MTTNTNARNRATISFVYLINSIAWQANRVRPGREG